jgi:hypothetical protein
MGWDRHPPGCNRRYAYLVSGAYDVRICGGCGSKEWDHGGGYWRNDAPADYREKAIEYGTVEVLV